MSWHGHCDLTLHSHGWCHICEFTVISQLSNACEFTGVISLRPCCDISIDLNRKLDRHFQLTKREVDFLSTKHNKQDMVYNFVQIETMGIMMVVSNTRFTTRYFRLNTECEHTGICRRVIMQDVDRFLSMPDCAIRPPAPVLLFGNINLISFIFIWTLIDVNNSTITCFP